MNKNMLISKMKLFGDTQQKLADALGLSLARTNAKINGTDGAEFTMGEMQIIKNRYRLTADEVDQIFFKNTVHCEGTHHEKNCNC
jgi:hypothetical protein